jgi:hypothetical protein
MKEISRRLSGSCSADYHLSEEKFRLPNVTERAKPYQV